MGGRGRGETPLTYFRENKREVEKGPARKKKKGKGGGEKRRIYLTIYLPAMKRKGKKRVKRRVAKKEKIGDKHHPYLL